MRTIIPTIGGMIAGAGLYRIWNGDYKVASILLTVSTIVYFIGYLIEIDGSYKKDKELERLAGRK